MSSMVRISLLALLLVPMLPASAPVIAQDAAQWDVARAQSRVQGPGTMAGAVQRWAQLTASPGFSFHDYSGFLLSYPGLPDEARLRGYAETRLEREGADPARITGFFDRVPPLTNPARARYALALAAQNRPEALDMARAAWRGGAMAEGPETSLMSMFGQFFSPEDHDTRMDALLWARDTPAATRQFAYVSPQKRSIFMARLSAVQGSNPQALGIPIPADARSDPGYLFNMSLQLRRSGQTAAAVDMLANRPVLSSLPLEQAMWVNEMLVTARNAPARAALRIAASIDDGFAPGADISAMAFRLRDDYTSLMWLGGTKALHSLNDPGAAAPLFYRYGAAARTAQTRSKGFYWAGLAASRAGDTAGASRYFTMAAYYPDRFYGQLALERLGRPIPDLTGTPQATITPAEREAFRYRPITLATRDVARDAPWSQSIRFFRQIAESAETASDHMLVAELAREIGRRDLAVILGESAQSKRFTNFELISFPTMPIPHGTDWTMVHAIARQESQFAQNAISHAGARGLMQLMPGTAREQAGKLGLSYDLPGLISDPNYNIRLGDGYFARMLSYYGGSYPLAVAAYNAGPGNLNKWLRANGDPRNGALDWLEWIENIPIFETRNYVHRVLENAVVYEQMHPANAPYRQPRGISRFIGKSTPG